MKLARYSFLIAGIYGLLSLSPMYFLEAKNGRDFPPAITHPEFYYGFIGVALAWQVLFLVLSINPKRYRPMMIPAMLEKLSFAVPVIALFLQSRVAFLMVVAAVPDLIFLGLFIAAFIKTRNES